MSAGSDVARQRVAWWSPWPPSRSGIAEYSRSLIRHLREHVAISVFIDPKAATQPVERMPGVTIWSAQDFPAAQAKHPFTVGVFHLGNQAGHAYMTDALLKAPYPRVGVFHDGSLYHLYEGISRYRLIREIAAEEGVRAAWRAWHRLRQTGSESYHYPLLRKLAGACNALVAHSTYLAARLKTATAHQLSQPMVTVIPFGATCFPDDGGQVKGIVRRIVGLPQDALIFGVFGHITAAKRVDRVIQAFVEANLPKAWLYIVGEMTPLAPNMLRQWASDPACCLGQRILFDARYRTPEYLLWAMQAVDVGIVLRFPTTGENSAVASDLLGMGKPCIVSAIGAFNDLPTSCVIKVPAGGDDELTALRAAMRHLASQPAQLASMSQAARAYSCERSWQIVAQRYLQLINGLAQPLSAWRAPN